MVIVTATVMRLAGNDEDKREEGKANGNGNEGGGRQRGQGWQGDGNGNKDCGQVDCNSNKEGNDDGDKGGG
jgi:hypothetical protein